MTLEPDPGRVSRGRGWIGSLWRQVAALADSQHGVVARHQLLALGVSTDQVDRAIASGRLHPVHRGIYAVGRRGITQQGRWMAAVLSGGPDAVLSHHPAGAEWGLRRWSGAAEITVPRWRPGVDGVIVHTSTLAPDERTVTEDGIPITTVTRTLLDLASVLDDDAMARALEEARELRSPSSLPTLMERYPGRRGLARLRRVRAAAGYGLGITKRELEELFVRFIGELSLPHPELNAWLQLDDGFLRPDALWRSQRVIVELQSVRHHTSREALTRDAGKFRRYAIAGYTPVAVTWRQLTDANERRMLASDLAHLFAPR